MTRTHGTALRAGAKGCIRVVTRTGTYSNYADGRVTVYVDRGTGFEAATPINKYYDEGATVLDACYNKLTAVRMQNTNGDGWWGSITFASTKAGPYRPGYCTTCNKQGSSADIEFDGDDNSWSAKAKCENGKMCDITFALEAPTSGASPHQCAHHRHAPADHPARDAAPANQPATVYASPRGVIARRIAVWS